MDGILNINKPLGITSFGVVARIKRLVGERRVGHAGTLDPAAAGVLPVCLGRATRVVEYLADAAKTYQAEIELGTVTDTYDATGRIIEKKDPSYISRTDIESALASFRGTIEQVPPMYSAVKHSGRPLYRLARAGVEVERPKRRAQIYSLELTGWEPPVATVLVVCGKGTYIRSLAHDLGQLLGCGAYLKGLVRLGYGIFSIRDAISLEKMEEAAHEGYWPYFVYPADSVLSQWGAVIVGEAGARAIGNGRPVTYPGPSSGSNRCRAYNTCGCFLGVLQYSPEGGIWQPEKVFQTFF